MTFFHEVWETLAGTRKLNRAREEYKDSTDKMYVASQQLKDEVARVMADQTLSGLRRLGSIDRKLKRSDESR